MITRILKSNQNLDLDGYYENLPEFVSASRNLFTFNSKMR